MPERTFVGTLQNIEELWTNECDANWWTYVRTAVPAAGSALWQIIVPSTDEILENYIEPDRIKRGGKLGTKDDWRRYQDGDGTEKRGRKPGWLQLDEKIAALIPGAEVFKARQVSSLEHMFWTGFNVVERASWYWMLYQTSKDFVYEWHSNVFKSACEKAPGYVACYIEIPSQPQPPFSLGPFSDQWVDETANYINCHVVTQEILELHLTILPKCFYTVIGHNISNDPEILSIGLTLQTSFGQDFRRSDTVSVPPGGFNEAHIVMQAQDINRLIASYTARSSILIEMRFALLDLTHL